MHTTYMYKRNYIYIRIRTVLYIYIIYISICKLRRCSELLGRKKTRLI